VAKSQQIRLFQ